MALYVAAEDDSLVSHSSVPLPVDAFIDRLDDLSVGYCSHFVSAYRSSPLKFLNSMEDYMYVKKGFHRSNAKGLLEPRAFYLHSVMTHRSGSATMLSLLYSEILKRLRLWGIVNFDAEIFFPHDLESLPRGYDKRKGKEVDQQHVMTSQALRLQVFYIGEPSGFQLAFTKAAHHRLERGIWTSVHLGDMRLALAACERLILLEVDPREFRDYSILLYHCGFYCSFSVHTRRERYRLWIDPKTAPKDGGRCCRKTNGAPSFVNDGWGLEPAIPGQIFPGQQSRTMVKDVQGFLPL